MLSPALLHVLVVADLLFSRHAEFRILCGTLLRHLVMANFALHIAALLRELHRTFKAGHIVAFFAFLCAADFVELKRAFLKRFLMADFPWCALAFFKEFGGTLLGELFIALFLLLCATFLPLRGLALFFVLCLAVGHLLHLTRGAVLRCALVLELVGTHLFVGRSTLWRHHVLHDIEGETWCMDDTTSSSAWKSVIILIPVRLGSEVFNPIYNSCIKNLLTLECCIGIIGGKPKHSLYFIGFQDEDLIHLDPHRLQDKVDTNNPNFNTESYHPRNPRKIQLKKLDPSCCIGFYLRTREDWSAWCSTISSLVTPPQISGIRAEYPMFVVAPGRGSDTRGLGDWVSLGSDSITSQSPNNNDMETEEFVFL